VISTAKTWDGGYLFAAGKVLQLFIVNRSTCTQDFSFRAYMRCQSAQVESYKYGEGFPALTWSLPRITEKLSFQPKKNVISIKEFF